MEECDCSVLSDYLTNPYILPTADFTMSLARTNTTAGSYYYDTRCTHHFVETFMKQSLTRRSSFSFGSKFRKPEAFSLRNVFKWKPGTRYPESSSASTVSSLTCQTSQSTEEFWNQYKRHYPKLSLTLRAKQMVVKPVPQVGDPPTIQHSSISL